MLKNKEIGPQRDNKNNSINLEVKVPKTVVIKHLSSLNREHLIQDFLWKMPKNFKPLKNKMIANTVFQMKSTLNK